MTRATADMLARADTEAVLTFQGEETTRNIPPQMRERSAQLFRCGLLLGAAPAGDGRTELTQNDSEYLQLSVPSNACGKQIWGQWVKGFWKPSLNISPHS